MAIKTTIEPISDFIEIAVSEMLSPQAQSRVVADFARERLEEAQEQNRTILGRIPPHESFVDGKSGAPLESVRPDGGVIVFEFELVADVLRWIGQALADRSPVMSGEYKRSHMLFADGKEIAIGDRMPPAEEYSFTNLIPYARKIEIGKTRAGRDFVLQVPNRIYERTARDARARFGNLAKIEFTFRGIVGGYQLKAGSRGTAHNKSDVRYPTIVVHLGDRFTRI